MTEEVCSICLNITYLYQNLYKKHIDTLEATMKKYLIKFISVIMLMQISTSLLTSCRDDVALDPSNMIKGDWEDSTDNVAYSGWNSFVFDGTYVVTGEVDGKMNKYNVLSGTGTPLSEDEDTQLNLSQHADFQYIENGIAYGRTFEWGERNESGKLNIDYYLISCNLATGHVERLLTVNGNDVESLYGICFSDGYAYYQRMIPNTDKPTSVDDYTRTFCRFDLDAKEETALFTANDENRMSEESYPAFVEDGWIYFQALAKGALWRTDMEGKQYTEILPSKGMFEQPGIYYCDGWVYYLINESKEDKFEPYLYRTNADLNKTEKLSDEDIDWFYVTDNCIYYGLEEFNINRMEHDGSEVVELPPYELDFKTTLVAIGGICLAGDQLWLDIGYQTETAMGGGALMYEISSGVSQQIGKQWTEGTIGK